MDVLEDGCTQPVTRTVTAGEKVAELVQVKVVAMAGRNVYLL